MNKLCMESRIVCPISSFKLLVRNTFSHPFLTFGEKSPCVLGNSRVILDLSNNVKRGSLNFFSKKYCCHIFLPLFGALESRASQFLFLKLSFHRCLSCVHNCNQLSGFYSFFRSTLFIIRVRVFLKSAVISLIHCSRLYCFLGSPRKIRDFRISCRKYD